MGTTEYAGANASARRTTSKRGRLKRLGIVAAFGLQSLVGCKPTEPEPVATETDILCDFSQNGPCSATRLDAVARVEFERAASAPGSTVRVWMLGETASDTVLVFETTSTAASRPGKTKGNAKDFVATNREGLKRAADAYLQSHEPARQSPVAEGLTRVARYARGSKRPRRLDAITDLRQVGKALGYDFECRALPDAESFASTLHRSGLLLPGSMQGVAVICSFVDLPPTGRCSATIANQAQLEALWLAVLTATGADVRIVVGPPDRGVPALGSNK